MLHWSPSSDSFKQYTPVGGWNVVFSMKEKIESTNLYFFFKMKGYSDTTASKMSQMLIFKHKYHGMNYSKEQENMLQQAISFTRKKH